MLVTLYIIKISGFLYMPKVWISM